VDKCLSERAISSQNDVTSDICVSCRFARRYLGARQVADSETDAHVKSEAFKDKVARLYEQQYSDKGKNKGSDDDAGLLATLGLTGDETHEQFSEAMARMVREHNMFSGHETPESLTAVQCRTLIRHFERCVAVAALCHLALLPCLVALISRNQISFHFLLVKVESMCRQTATRMLF
jgi:hypothetical protein